MPLPLTSTSLLSRSTASSRTSLTASSTYSAPSSLPDTFGVGPLFMWDSASSRRINSEVSSTLGARSTAGNTRTAATSLSVVSELICNPPPPSMTTSSWIMEKLESLSATRSSLTPSQSASNAAKNTSHRGRASTPEHMLGENEDEARLKDGDYDVDDGSVPESSDNELYFQQGNKRSIYVDDEAVVSKRKRTESKGRHKKSYPPKLAANSGSEEEPPAKRRKSQPKSSPVKKSGKGKRVIDDSSDDQASRGPERWTYVQVIDLLNGWVLIIHDTSVAPVKELFSFLLSLTILTRTQLLCGHIPPLGSLAKVPTTELSAIFISLQIWEKDLRSTIGYKLERLRADAGSSTTLGANTRSTRATSLQEGRVNMRPPGHLKMIDYGFGFEPPHPTEMASVITTVSAWLSGSNHGVEYVENWEAVDQQTPHLTTLVAAKSIPCTSVGIIDLENFYILTAVWRSNSTLILGASNGVVYEMVMNPKNPLHPVSMYAIIGPLHQQVRVIAFDATGVHTLLAIGHGTQVSIYAQTLQDHDWNKVDDILEPSHTRAGLVTSLLFFGKGGRKLFIGYAEEGWTIWEYGASTIRRVDPANYSGVCRVGQARLGPNQESIAITTLDQSIMTYRLGDHGPILESGHEYPLQVPLASNPILPIEHTLSGLILGGTSSGDVSIIKPPKDGGNVGALIRGIRQGDGHLIRAFAYYGPHVLVGSTTPKNQVMIKCFTDSQKFKGSARKRSSYKPFRLSLSDVLVVSKEGQKRTAVTIDHPTGVMAFIRSRDAKMFVVLTLFLWLIILSSDPPGGEAFRATHTPSLQKGVRVMGDNRHTQWILFGLRYFTRYAFHQSFSWGSWTGGVIYDFVKHIATLPVAIVKFTLVAISHWMCERVEIYRELGICPQIYYT
ncbi:unnamed protein product [Rhizoctonia solani]|uniref:Uncharacterized protein n=1 Tax=Rhizoctonia solani TaxID=456999 RepID=A0A8H3DUI1_9AGAM|nr:unnamed protein product [Rhizoctonia solani]